MKKLFERERGKQRNGKQKIATHILSIDYNDSMSNEIQHNKIKNVVLKNKLMPVSMFVKVLDTYLSYFKTVILKINCIHVMSSVLNDIFYNR